MQREIHRLRPFLFLRQSSVRTDINGSEAALRNIKVNQKISGQFKSLAKATVFTILHLGIASSTNKNNNSV